MKYVGQQLYQMLVKFNLYYLNVGKSLEHVTYYTLFGWLTLILSWFDIVFWTSQSLHIFNNHNGDKIAVL